MTSGGEFGYPTPWPTCSGGRNVVLYGHTKQIDYTYVGCRTEEQAHYVRERVLECREILNRHCRYYGFICPPALRMITVPELPEG